MLGKWHCADMGLPAGHAPDNDTAHMSAEKLCTSPRDPAMYWPSLCSCRSSWWAFCYNHREPVQTHFSSDQANSNRQPGLSAACPLTQTHSVRMLPLLSHEWMHVSCILHTLTSGAPTPQSQSCFKIPQMWLLRLQRQSSCQQPCLSPLLSGWLSKMIMRPLPWKGSSLAAALNRGPAAFQRCLYSVVKRGDTQVQIAVELALVFPGRLLITPDRHIPRAFTASFTWVAPSFSRQNSCAFKMYGRGGNGLCDAFLGIEVSMMRQLCQLNTAVI